MPGGCLARVPVLQQQLLHTHATCNNMSTQAAQVGLTITQPAPHSDKNLTGTTHVAGLNPPMLQG